MHKLGPYELKVAWIETDLYNTIIDLVPIVCVDVAIVRQGKVLLIKRNDKPAKNEWWLPGGRLYKGEDLRTCARRKALEEVSLSCEVGQMIHYASTDFGSVHSVNFCYQLISQSGNVILDSHSSAYKWINVYDAFSYHPYVEDCLKAVKI